MDHKVPTTTCQVENEKNFSFVLDADGIEPVSPPSLDTAETTSKESNSKLLHLLETVEEWQDQFEKVKNIRRIWQNVSDCGTAYYRFKCKDCDELHDTPYTCNFRLCHKCAVARQAYLKNRYEEICSSMKHPVFITLTLKSHLRGWLSDMIDSLLYSFSRLRGRKIWRPITGGIRCLEIEYNPGAETWHAHLHILADMAGGVWDHEKGDFYLSQSDLSDSWADITGGSSVVWISKARADSIHEVLKYVSKLGKYMHHPHAFGELLESVHGRRMIQPFGSFFGIKLKKEGKEEPATCDKCGGELIFEKYGGYTPNPWDSGYIVLMDYQDSIRDARESLSSTGMPTQLLLADCS